MFNLEQSIGYWRQEMLAGGIKTPVLLDELEGHLREEVAKQLQSGLLAPQAFEAAVKKIGQAAMLKSEFKKLEVKSWNRHLAWTAWGMYVVSFFLPSYMDGPGWACALYQRWFWNGAIHGNWPSINYELLTLANLLMLASPLLLFRYGGSPRILRWLRGLNLTAVLLVWAFLGLLLSDTHDRSALRIGCYVWGLSFVVLQVSTVPRLLRKKELQFA